MNIAFFGSSLVSAYWNGAATYYRGILRALHERGHRISFYEPDAWDRQQHRDIAPPDYARSIVYPATEAEVLRAVQAAARQADLLVKASGVGVFDELLEEAVLSACPRSALAAFWDVDAAASLERMARNPDDSLRRLIPRYDIVFTYGGGDPVVNAYRELGATACVPIYNALDPTTHFPVEPDPRFTATLAFLGNRLPDRERRVQEFFFAPARANPDLTMLLGGNGWDDIAPQFRNVRYLGHVYTADHNAFNSTPRAVLNICRDSMARCGFSPPTRVFEAAGAGACLITDAWEGIEKFLEPGRECLVARDGAEVSEILSELSDERAARIGAAALEHVLSEHTYAQRAVEVENTLCASTPPIHSRL
jgi:spore maturation protein CgeB